MLLVRRCVRTLVRKPIIPAPRAASDCLAFRSFATSAICRNKISSNDAAPGQDSEQFIERYVRSIRDAWGNNLPEGLLLPEEYIVYERYFGPPLRFLTAAEVEEELGLFSGDIPEPDAPGAVTIQDANGVEIDLDAEPVLTAEELAEGMIRVRTEKEAAMYARIGEDIQRSLSLAEDEGGEEDNALETHDGYQEDEDVVSESTQRTHPLTQLGRFGTYPATITTPEAITGPTSRLLSDVNNRHLDEAASRILGGPILPNSPILTGRAGKAINSIPLDTSHGMSDMEANVYLATILPGYYAQSLSTLTELRRRLGRDWILGSKHSNEPGVKRVLDVGTGGAGILAWRAMAEAEQVLRGEEAAEIDGVEPIDAKLTENAPAEGPTEGAAGAPTEGAAGAPTEGAAEEPAKGAAEEQVSESFRPVVVIGSNSLRYRMTKFLENTTFISRLPDVMDADMHQADSLSTDPEASAPKQPRKLYDLIIATNTVLPIHEAHKRKTHVQNLWSLLNPAGGVLVLIEKGTPRGFEAIAGARENLLRYNISTTGSEFVPLTDANDMSDPRSPKETASIVAPCTNHSQCPMYIHGPGQSMRRDYCSFLQRYERPGYMQRVLKAKARNHEDLQYSYIAVRRGVDVTLQENPVLIPKMEDFDTTADPPRSPYSMAQLRSFAYTLPRTVFPPFKRRGHVIIDVCTAHGKIERWTVPRSYGKAAFRDARKVRWGDLWALGAKTKIPRNLSLGEKGPRVRKKVERVVDFAKGELKEMEMEMDKPGGKKRNPGKRERERREARREQQKSRAKERNIVEKVVEGL